MAQKDSVLISQKIFDKLDLFLNKFVDKSVP